MKIVVQVVPNSSKKKGIEWKENILKVHLPVEPKKGKANQALISILAKKYGVPISSIQIVQGKKTKQKLIEIKTP